MCSPVSRTPAHPSRWLILGNNTACELAGFGKFIGVSTVTEIQAALPKLSRAEIKSLREWIEDYLEDHLDLTDEVKQKLDQSRAEIASGRL